MNCEYIKMKSPKPIYDYYNSVKNTVPYWFDVDYSLWLESYESDTDYEGDIMFSELITYAAFAEKSIIGFIQFGISNYTFNQNGEKDYSEKCGVIRNLHFLSKYRFRITPHFSEKFFSYSVITLSCAFSLL